MRRDPFLGRPSDPDHPSYYNQAPDDVDRSEWISPTYSRLAYSAPPRQRSEVEQESTARDEQTSMARDVLQEPSYTEASSMEYVAAGAREDEQDTRRPGCSEASSMEYVAAGARDDEQDTRRPSCSEASSVEYVAAGGRKEEEPRPWRRRMLSKCMRNE